MQILLIILFLIFALIIIAFGILSVKIINRTADHAEKIQKDFFKNVFNIKL